MHRARIVLVTPALADANNGNWQTARRWARMLGRAYRVTLADRWQGAPAADLMLALHARRSAPAVQAWRAHAADRPLVLALTGTDLYRDIDHDADAQASLTAADALVVLNDAGARRLPPALRGRVHVVLQSCTARVAPTKPVRHLRALMAGHLRAEKDPETYWRAVRRLAGRSDLRFDHAGAALDPALGAGAAMLAADVPGFRWLGGLSHAHTRRRIQEAHVLVHPSRMEGGAHVVIEAVRSGTPVLASRIDGNLGLLGEDWPATFDVGDDAALARLLARCRDDPGMLAALAGRAAAVARRFEPEAEARALQRVVAGCLRG